MRKLMLMAAVAAAFSTSVYAGIPERDVIALNGKIVSVEPIMLRVRTETPNKTCTTIREPVIKKSQNGSGVGTIIGAIAGGVIGNQIGGGSGKDVATGIGVITGAAVGNEMSKDQHIEYQERVQCQITNTVEYVNKLDGYFVIVSVNGQKATLKWDRPDKPRVGDYVTVLVSYELN